MDVNLSDPNLQTLISYLGEPTSTTTGELRFRSPFQDKFKNPFKEDRKKHLYVNLTKGKFFCFKSNMAGSLSYLFALLGVELQEASVRVETTLDDLRQRLATLGASQEKFTIPIAELPEWYQPVTWGSEVHRYLRGRGVSDEDVRWYNVGEGTGDMYGWVILPNFNKVGDCEYWVARNTKFKTYHNPSVDRRFHVLFLEKALEVSPGEVTVCEGVFSAMAAGRDAVAALGKFVTDDQIRRMWDAGVRRVNLALDGDAWQETLDTAERCLKIGIDVFILPLPMDQDPGDLGRQAFERFKKAGMIHVTPLELPKLRLVTM